MIGGFSFEHDGRTYTCTVETQRSTPNQPRWWFAVTGDQQRYAPIEAASGDTQASVRSRIIAFYTQHLFMRSQPAAPRGHWGQGRKATPPQSPDSENETETAAS